MHFLVNESAIKWYLFVTGEYFNCKTREMLNDSQAGVIDKDETLGQSEGVLATRIQDDVDRKNLPPAASE